MSQLLLDLLKSVRRGNLSLSIASMLATTYLNADLLEVYRVHLAAGAAERGGSRSYRHKFVVCLLWSFLRDDPAIFVSWYHVILGKQRLCGPPGDRTVR